MFGETFLRIILQLADPSLSSALLSLHDIHNYTSFAQVTGHKNIVNKKSRMLDRF